MTTLERTLQQLDPLAAIVGRPLTYLAAFGIPLYSGVMLWFNRADIDSMSLAVASLFVLALVSVVFLYVSSPLRAPFSRWQFVLVLAGGAFAHLLAAASMFERNAFVRDDWGPAALALFIVAATPYRPARELAVAGVLASIFVVAVASAQAHSFVTPVPFHLIAVVAIAPIVVLASGATMFAAELANGLDRWAKLKTMSASALGLGGKEWIARSVQQDRVTLLNQEIVPYFAAVLEGEELSDEHRSRARELSEAIRAIMVAEIDRSWLRLVLETEARSRGELLEASALVDRDALADRMTSEQRTALRAFLVALFLQPDHEAGSVTIRLMRLGTRCEAQLTAAVGSSELSMRGALDPFFAVMRIVFRDLQVDYDHPELTLRFSYGT